MAPEPLRKIILEHCHDMPGSGHMGMNKTTERVKRYAIWYKMLDNCLVYVRSCSNRQKKPKKKTKAHHVQYHAGFSKWVECYALSDQTAEQVDGALVSEFIGRLCCPLELHSDQGRNF